MKIEPRKESDRGGWLCMPLLASVPSVAATRINS